MIINIISLLSVAAVLPFTLGFWTCACAQAAGPAALGFSLDYTQVRKEVKVGHF